MKIVHAAMLTLVSACSLLANSAAGQTILRVKAGAPAGGNGSSWATAYNNLQAALAAAVAGDEIWVAAGTYTSTGGLAAYFMKSGVNLYGGFVGSESERSARNPSANMTVLSGLDQSVNRARSVVAFVGVVDSSLDGFHLRSGSGRGDIFSDPARGFAGGGVHVNGGNARIVGCEISENYGGFLIGASGFPASSGGDGGGAFVKDAQASFENCRFVGNVVTSPVPKCSGGHPVNIGRAGHGAGMVALSSQVSLVGCEFRSNRASNGNSGFGCPSTGFVSAGTNGGSGGAFYGVGTSLIVERCKFIANECGSGGGGGSYPFTTQCVTGPGTPGDGGAICNQGDVTITNSLFVGNRSHTNGTSCSNNTGGLGGAIYAVGDLHISNSLFYANASPGSSGNRGTVDGNSGNVSNCIFWMNSGDLGMTVQAQVGSINASAIRNCIVQGLETGIGIANSNLDPLFVDPDGQNGVLGDADDRFDLSVLSHGIDSGDNTGFGELTSDLAGNARFFDVLQVPDTGTGTAPIIDIGPYEFSRCPADLDNGSGTGAPDNAVTIDDLLYFLAVFESGTNAADLDNGTATGVLDNAVTVDDLLFFLVRFEIGC